MRKELFDAIESARTVGIERMYVHEAKPQRTYSFATVRALVLAVMQEIPSEMTAGEIAEELSIAQNQAEATR
mgnify:CR=1 FL=1